MVKAGVDEARFIGRAKGTQLGAVPAENGDKQETLALKSASVSTTPRGDTSRDANVKKTKVIGRRLLIKGRARKQSGSDQTLSKQIAVAKKRAHRSPLLKTVATPLRTPAKSARSSAKKLAALIKKAKRGSK